jgi:hypothetical protein
MTAAGRFLGAGLAVSVGEAALAVVAIPTGLGRYLAACAGATMLFTILARRLLVSPPDGPGDGGRGDGPVDDPPPPPWWPEFEAGFRAHVHDKRHDRLPG